MQARIKKLRFEFHEERRAKEEAKREAEEAARFAKSRDEELARLRKMVKDGESVLYEQATGRIDAQINSAKREYREAYEAGDSEKLAEASAKIAGLEAEKQRVRSFGEEIKRRKPEESSREQIPAPKREVRPEVPKPSARAMTWAEENSSWFQVDNAMTGYAFGLHENLVKAGVQPDSEEYYRQIDENMRKTFPNKFSAEKETSRQKPGTVVAPAERSAKKPRTVRLTQTQVRLAEKLGLTKQQYAQALLDEEARKAQQ